MPEVAPSSVADWQHFAMLRYFCMLEVPFEGKVFPVKVERTANMDVELSKTKQDLI